MSSNMGNPTQPTQKESSYKGDPFEMTALAKTEAPAGAQGTNWYRYVITQGANTIVGYRQGSLRTVRNGIDEIVVRLNERRAGKVGRVHLTPSPKRTR